jgi:hypothetical protein
MAISLSVISRSQDQQSRTDNLVGQGAVAGLPPGEEFPGRKRGDAHALTPLEREMIVQVANEPRFADKPPARIVPALADAGICLASESSFQRLLRERRQTAHRGRAKPPRKVRPPTTRVATAPRKVWCWDVTYLPVLIPRPLVLPVPDPGHLQPQDRRVRSARHRRWRACRALAQAHGAGRRPSPVAAVTLNPERETAVAAKLRSADENRQTA